MARIRSLHPGQWTDEEFVSCSAEARLLALALRNEADDNGVFQWKPTTLKMRLLPADSVDCAELLQELVDTRQVMKFEVDGKSYGAIRNFHAFQSPRKPRPVYPVTHEVRRWVGLSIGGDAPDRTNDAPSAEEQADVPDACESGAEPVTHECGTRDAPVRDGDEPVSPGEGEGNGCGRGGEESDSRRNRHRGRHGAAKPNGGGGEAQDYWDESTPTARACRRIQRCLGYMPNELGTYVQRWLDHGLDVDKDLLPAVESEVERRRKRKNTDQISSMKYFDKAVFRAHRQRTEAPPGDDVSGRQHADGNDEDPEHSRWRARLAAYRDRGMWVDQWGDRPDERRCQAPHDVLVEFGYRQDARRAAG
jgi:hypothetical protein